ncbi:MAG TPA: hypothetical protein VMV18_02675 [bacterium]|nr:hypothetical protein [bacterium]
MPAEQDDGAPLTAEERGRAAALGRVWTVWYEDRFERDSEAWPSAWFRDEASAKSWAEKQQTAAGPESFERWTAAPYDLAAPSSPAREVRAALSALQ